MDWREQSADGSRDNETTYQKVESEDRAQKIPWGTSLSFSDPIVRKISRCPSHWSPVGVCPPTFKSVGACRLHCIAGIAEIRQTEVVDRPVMSVQLVSLDFSIALNSGGTNCDRHLYIMVIDKEIIIIGLKHVSEEWIFFSFEQGVPAAIAASLSTVA